MPLTPFESWMILIFVIGITCALSVLIVKLVIRHYGP